MSIGVTPIKLASGQLAKQYDVMAVVVVNKVLYKYISLILDPSSGMSFTKKPYSCLEVLLLLLLLLTSKQSIMYLSDNLNRAGAIYCKSHCIICCQLNGGVQRIG